MGDRRRHRQLHPPPWKSRLSSTHLNCLIQYTVFRCLGVGGCYPLSSECGTYKTVKALAIMQTSFNSFELFPLRSETARAMSAASARYLRRLVFKAHRLLYHSTLGSIVIKKEKKILEQSNAREREQLVSALEATQGQIDGFFSQLPHKCHQNRVAFVGD